MKTKIITIVATSILFQIGAARADTIWLSGHHEIVNGDIYGEIWMYNDCTLDILGGDIYRLAVYDTTVTDWFSGEMTALWTRNDSIVNIYGGDLAHLWADDNSEVYIYAYDVIHHPTGGHFDRGWVEGKYIDNDSYFAFDLGGLDSFSHINVVPEPSTILFIVLGGFLVRRRY